MPIQAPQWTDFLTCPICCREFGSEPRSPISLSCGHTVCHHCISQLHRKQCPFDQTVINTETENLVVNTALLQLAGYPPPQQPFRPTCIRNLPLEDQQFYDQCIQSIEELSSNLKYSNNGSGSSRLSRPMQRKLVTLVHCAIHEEDGRGRAYRAARSLGERTVTELILQHQNPQQLSANLWAAVRARGCQFLGPAMQEEVLKLVLLALEDGSALSRKVLVMFVVQRLEPHFPQASKTSIGHVVQLLYRASCFKVSKRESDSSLMQLKEEFRTYESLRREHDAQIVQIATEAGLRIAPDQWSALLYGDTSHKSHMQSIIDKLQTPSSFAQSVQELIIALQRTGDPARLTVLGPHLELLAAIEPTPDYGVPTWAALSSGLKAAREVVVGLVHFGWQHNNRDSHTFNNRLGRHSQLTPGNERVEVNPLQHSSSTTVHVMPSAVPSQDRLSGNLGDFQQTSIAGTPNFKVVMCRNTIMSGVCPRGEACTYAHCDEELEHYRNIKPRRPNGNAQPRMDQYQLMGPDITFSNINIRPEIYHSAMNGNNEIYNGGGYPSNDMSVNSYINNSAQHICYSGNSMLNEPAPTEVNTMYRPNQVYSNVGYPQQVPFNISHPEGFSNLPSTQAGLNRKTNSLLHPHFITESCAEEVINNGIITNPAINTGESISPVGRWSGDSPLYSRRCDGVSPQEHSTVDHIEPTSEQQTVFPINSATQQDIFVRSDSILTDDDYVPYEAPSGSKFGPISRVLRDMSRNNWGIPFMGTPQGHRGLTAVNGNDHATGVSEPDPTAQKRDHGIIRMADVFPSVVAGTSISNHATDKSVATTITHGYGSEDTYEVDIVNDMRELELKWEHELLEVEKRWSSEDEIHK